MVHRRRIALYTPFDLVPGGGERYLLAMANTLQRYGSVKLLAHERYSELRVLQLCRDLGLVLREGIRVERYSSRQRSTPYDLFVAMGNEALAPVSGLGRINLFICQFPFPGNAALLRARRNLDSRYSNVLVYSEFTRSTLIRTRERLGITSTNATVLFPPCRVSEQPPPDREFGGVVRIVSVGRFFTAGHAKRQDLLISAFRRLVSGEHSGGRYELTLVGAANAQWGSRGYLESLRRSAAGLPVTVHVNATIGKLREILERSDIYWHATGLGAPARRHPERLEHFGISVVEAMGSGCVPVVFRGGGLLEIVEEGRSGYAFRSIGELVATTRRLATVFRHDCQEAQNWRRTVWSAAQRFSDAAFAERLTALVEQSGV